MHGVRDTLTKSSDDKQIFMWLFILAELIIALPAFLYFGLRDAQITQTIVLLLITAGCIHTTYAFLLSKTLQHGDLSHVYPIIRSAPVLITIIAVTALAEQVSTQAIAGIALVICGAYMINMKRWSLRAALEPLMSIPTEHPTQLAILTMFAVTAYSLFDKQMMMHIHPVTYVFLIDVFIFCVFTPYIFLRKTRKAINSEWDKNKWAIWFNGAIALVGYIFILYAYTMAKVSYVTGLRQISIVFAVLLGGHVLKEKNKAIRLTAGIIICIGSALIALAE